MGDGPLLTDDAGPVAEVERPGTYDVICLPAIAADSAANAPSGRWRNWRPPATAFTRPRWPAAATRRTMFRPSRRWVPACSRWSCRQRQIAGG